MIGKEHHHMRILALILACGLALASEAQLQPETGLTKADKGTLEGTVQKIEKGKVTLLVDGKLYLVMPQWVGGAPKDGGGPDKDTMAQIEKIKVGDQVSVEWFFNEHRRIKSIEAKKK
jgi:hypothetical protein